IQYKNARKCLLNLKGPGKWQETFQELKGSDICGIGERALSAEEKEMLRVAQIQAGVSEEEVDKMLDDNISNMLTADPINPVLALGETKCTLSWIWYTVSGSEVDEDNVNVSLQVEWCKARARAQHSREELLLVDEEMHWVITYTTHRAQWWLQQSNRWMDIDVALKDGLVAYSCEQAHIEQERAQRWLSDWAPV
ncbi:hypothetical protein GYMLUDRAFT_170046, partial [Collybiopsis luxurians FD-317 M1]